MQANSKIRGFSLEDLIPPLRRNFRWACAGFVSVMATVIFLTLTSPRVYRASGTLLLQQGEEGQGSLLEVPSILRQKYWIKNQVAVLQSRTLAEAVIRALEQSSYRDSLQILGYVPPEGKKYTLKRILGISSKKGRQALSMPQKVKQFQASIHVSYGRDTDLIELQAEAPSAWESAILVNTWINVYRNFGRSLTHNEVSQTRAFLEAKLKEMEEKLAQSEKALTQFEKQNQVVSLSGEIQQLVGQMSSFESMYNQTKIELDALKEENAYLQRQLDQSKQFLVEDMVKVSSPVLQELQRQMATLVAEKAAYEAQLISAGYSTDKDVKLAQMESRLNGVKEKIIEETKKLLQRDLSTLNPLDRSSVLITEILKNETTQKSLQAKLESLQKLIDEYNRRMVFLPDKSLKLAQLERDVQMNTKLYMMLREKYEEVKIQEANQAEWMKVVDWAVPPSSPIRPNTKLNLLLGFCFGILFGMALAYTKELLTATFRTRNDLELLGFFVIGEVPFLKPWKKYRLFSARSSNNRQTSRAREIYSHVMFYEKPEIVPLIESYRAIRTTLLLFRREKKWKTFLCTSANPEEGKSTTVTNLAITLAQNGIKTLVIDADLRRPVQSMVFLRSHPKLGLSSYLEKHISWREALRETRIKDLLLLPAGPEVKNAPELLTSRQMFRLFTEAKKEFGFVLCDSPPLLPVTDSAILATLTDCVLLVVKAGETRRDDLLEARERLEAVGASLAGVILIGVSSKEIIGYRDYYYHSY